MFQVSPPTAQQQKSIDRMVAAQRKALRRQRMARMLSMTDRILDRQVKDVVIDMSTSALAFTDGETIHLSGTQLPSLDTTLGVATWLGANYHELGHVMYTPRNDSPLKVRVREAGLSYLSGAHSAWNILEDQREERLMIAQFAPLRAYLATVVIELVADSGSDGTWPLLAGRTWLSDSVRSDSRDAFIAAHSVELADEVASLVGDFQRLTDTGYSEADEAFDIVERFCALLNDLSDTPRGGCTFNGRQGDDEAAGTDAVPAADDDLPGEASDEWFDSSDMDSDDDDDDDGDTVSGAGQGEGDEVPADGDADGDADSDEGDGEGSGNEASGSSPTGNDQGPVTPKELSEAIEQAVEDMIADNSDIASDIDSVEDALDHGTGDDAEGTTVRSHTMTPTHDQQVIRRNVEDHLARIIELAEPRTLRRVDHGKVNVGRYVTAQRFDPSVMFDRWEAGQDDEVSVELVVLLDTSGSMMSYGQETSPIEVASASVWAMLHAVDRAEGVATVLTYGTTHSIMTRKHDRPSAEVSVPNAGGGTNPTSALDQAYRILSESDAKHRILLSVTDGQWSAGADHVRALAQDGVITAMSLIGHGFEDANDEYAQHLLDRGRNGHQFVAGSVDGSGIAPLFDSIASDSLLGALA